MPKDDPIVDPHEPSIYLDKDFIPTTKSKAYWKETTTFDKDGNMGHELYKMDEK